MRLRRIMRQLRWYAREITGEAEYERYCARHPGRPVPTRGEYERMRSRHRETHPHSRCC